MLAVNRFVLAIKVGESNVEIDVKLKSVQERIVHAKKCLMRKTRNVA
jgi:hypothetical protein